MKNILFIVITSLLFSCSQDENNTLMNDLISKELSKNENVDEFFLDFKFGMDKTAYNNSIKSHLTSKDLFVFLDSYSYKFSQDNINWFLYPDFHNDSLIGITLRVIDNLSSDNLRETLNLFSIHESVLTQYIKLYGQPSMSVNRYDNYWFIKNMKIQIEKTDNDIRVIYENIRRMRKIDYSKYRIDEDLNSFDSAYFEQRNH